MISWLHDLRYSLHMGWVVILHEFKTRRSLRRNGYTP